MQHQQAVLQGGTLFAVKGHYFSAAFIIKGTAAATPACWVGPAAEPVICLAGHGVLQQREVFAAGRLIQNFAAAEESGAVAGVIVTVEHPQFPVVQTGGVIQRVAVGVSGDRSRRRRLSRGRRKHGAPAAQRQAERDAHSSAANAGKRMLHKITPYRTGKGRKNSSKRNGKFFRFNYNTKQPRFPLQEAAAADYSFMTKVQDADPAFSASSILPSCLRNASRKGSETMKVNTSAIG